MASLAAALERVYALHPKKIDLSLTRIANLLTRLGNPERKVPPVLHVAGTNGKGSTIAHMRAMLEADGKRVHVDTSPHLVRFNERFRIGKVGGGELVSDDELAATLAEIERINGGEPITVFEIITATGFVLFSHHPAEALLLEVGMGGRYDATNVIEHPAASLISSISMDHAEYLGDTVAKIAAEKAAIIKRRVPVVVGRQSAEALDVIVSEARRNHAPLSILGEHWHVREERGRLVYEDDDGLLDLPLSRLKGRHQIDNAGLAIAGLKAAKLLPSPAAIEAGLKTVSWPARLQPLMTGKLIGKLPQGSELWLDGGHNEDGGRVLADAISDMQAKAPRPLVMLCGLINTKDPKQVLAHFKPLKPHIFALPFTHAAALPPAMVAEAARSIGFEAEAALSLDDALARAKGSASGPLRVLIAGSLYLAGDILAADGTLPT